MEKRNKDLIKHTKKIIRTIDSVSKDKGMLDACGFEDEVTRKIKRDLFIAKRYFEAAVKCLENKETKKFS